MQLKEKKSSDSESRSPEDRFEQARKNKKEGRIDLFWTGRADDMPVPDGSLSRIGQDTFF